MRKYINGFFFKIFALSFIMLAALQAEANKYTGKSADISITVDNLRANPSMAKSHDNVRIYFDYTFSLTPSASEGWFKANDTIVVETNFNSAFDVDRFKVMTILDNAAVHLGDVYFDGNTMIYVVSAEAEDHRFASLFGEIHTDDIFAAKYVPTVTNVTMKVENKTATLVVNPLPVQLKVASVGLGTTTWTSTSPITSTITLTEGESIDITATPDADTNLHYINLGRGDGVSVSLWNTLTKSPQTVTVSYSDLAPGVNEVRVQYSSRAVEIMSGNWGQVDGRYIFTKTVWGVDWGNSANNDIYINESGIAELYRSGGTRVSENNLVANIFFEDSIPGNEEVTLSGGAPSIYAVLPWYEARSDGGYNAFSPERGRLGDWNARVGAAGHTNLVANGMLEKIEQSAADTKETFRARVKGTPLSYGVFIDPVSLSTFIFANLGSPGDPNGPGFKCSELWPTVMASDPVLNTINGDANCVNGKVQYFRIRFYSQYRNKYSKCYHNYAYISYDYATKDGGVEKAGQFEPFTWAGYCIERTNQLGKGAKYSLTIENLDAMDYSVAIGNSSFKLQVWDGSSWNDYMSPNTTGTDGIATFLNIAPNGKYRILQTSVPSPYYLPLGTKYSTIPGSMRNVSPDGEFTIEMADTTGVLAMAVNYIASRLVYNANGGSGDMTNMNVLAARNSRVSVAQPAYSYSGYNFNGWNTEANGSGTAYSPNQQFTLTSDLHTLYAQWVPTVSNIHIGKKILEGGTLAGYDYSFLLTPLKEEGGALVTDATATTTTLQNTVNGDVYVSSNSLTAGTWYYLNEIAGTDPDITYDGSGYLVHYKDDRSVEYHKSEISGTNYVIGAVVGESEVVFRNKYAGAITIDCPKAVDFEGNIYQSVRIGSYCWTTTNLKSRKYSDGRDIKNVMAYESNLHPDAVGNAEVFGLLYDWHAAVDTATNGTSPAAQVQGICPEGWLLPTAEQISELYGRDVKTLNSPDHWIQNAGTNETGFSALPSGRFNSQTGRFEDLGANCWFHSCTASGLSASSAGNISYFCDALRTADMPLNDGYSVRCVRE